MFSRPTFSLNSQQHSKGASKWGDWPVLLVCLPTRDAFVQISFFPPPFLFLALLVGLVLVCLYASVPSHPKRQLLLETVPLPNLLVCSCVCVFLSFFLSFFLFFFSFCFWFNCTKQQQHQHAVQGEGEGCVSERRRARAST